MSVELVVSELIFKKYILKALKMNHANTKTETFVGAITLEAPHAPGLPVFTSVYNHLLLTLGCP